MAEEEEEVGRIGAMSKSRNEKARDICTAAEGTAKDDRWRNSEPGDEQVSEWASLGSKEATAYTILGGII